MELKIIWISFFSRTEVSENCGNTPELWDVPEYMITDPPRIDTPLNRAYPSLNRSMAARPIVS